jgi:dTDP-4-dehydrorhamnose reductase
MTALKSWMVTGASGLLGSVLVSQLAQRGAYVHAIQNSHAVAFRGNVSVATGDLTDADWARGLVQAKAPDIIIHCAGLANVDRCEQAPDYAQLIHVDVSGMLALSARQIGARFVHISTDHLWDGTSAFATEEEPVSPINVYGRTKAEAETRVLTAAPEALVVRTNFFCQGLPWRPSFTDWAEQKLKAGQGFSAFTDSFFTPIEARLLSDVLIELAGLDVRGILHVCGSERLSKYEFVQRLARLLSVDARAACPGSLAEAHLQAPRPKDMSLSTARVAAILGRAMPDVEQSLGHLLKQPQLSS